MNPTRPCLAGIAMVCLAAVTNAQDMADVTIEAKRVAGNVYMITGRGGNMGLSVGPDGAFLIDDQFAPLTARIIEAVNELSPKRVQFVVNTHWHGDHTGGNENLGKAGAIIVAHDNVRRRMSTEHFMEAFNRTVPASPAGALPVITFAESMTFHYNGDEIRVQHVAPAHTDGDSIVFFRDANVIHMGDTFFNGMYPFIDASTGGSISGMIKAADTALALANEETRIIPGHGPLAGVTELRASRAMLTIVHDRVQNMIRNGSSRDDVIKAAPTADLDDVWGGGFMKPDQWVGIVYDGMTR